MISRVGASAEPPTLRSRQAYQQLLQNINFGRYTYSLLGSGNEPKLWLASCEVDDDESKFFSVGFMVYTATFDGGSDDVDYIECRFGPRNIKVTSSGSRRHGVPKLLNSTVEVPQLDSERSVMKYLLNVIMKSGYKEKIVLWYQGKHEAKAAAEPQPGGDSGQLLKELDHFFAYAKPVRQGSLTLRPYFDAHAGPTYRYAVFVVLGNDIYNYRLVYLSWNNPEFLVEVVGPDGILRKPALFYKHGDLGKLLKSAFKIIADDVNSRFVQATARPLYRMFVSAFTRIEDKDILIDGVVLQAHVVHEHGNAVVKLFAALNTEAAIPVTERRNRMWVVTQQGPSSVSIHRITGKSSELVRVVSIADADAGVRAVLATVVVDHNRLPVLAAAEPKAQMSSSEFETRFSRLFGNAKSMHVNGVDLSLFRVMASSHSVMAICNHYGVRYNLFPSADGEYTLQRATGAPEPVKHYRDVGSDPVAFFKLVIKDIVADALKRTQTSQAAAEPPQDRKGDLCKTLQLKYGLELDPERITHIGKDGIDYDGDVVWERENLSKIPVKFRNVTGSFYCSGNKLTSLENAPVRVDGGFYCRHNLLTSLEHAPAHVGGTFHCSDNRLTTLAHAPGHVGGDVYCRHNHLTSLDHAPKYIGGSFYCTYNRLPSDTKKPDGVHGKFVLGRQRGLQVRGAAEPSQPPLRFRAYVEDQPHILTVSRYKVEVNAKAYQKILHDDRFYGTAATTMMEAVEFSTFVPVQEPGRSRRYVSETYSLDKDRCLLRMRQRDFVKISKPITGTEATVFKVALTQFIRTCDAVAAGS